MQELKSTSLMHMPLPEPELPLLLPVPLEPPLLLPPPLLLLVLVPGFVPDVEPASFFFAPASGVGSVFGVSVTKPVLSSAFAQAMTAMPQTRTEATMAEVLVRMSGADIVF